MNRQIRTPNHRDDIIFERKEALQYVPGTYFPRGGEKVSMFQSNKFKNEHSVIDMSQGLQDLQLMIELGETNKIQADVHLRELGKGIKQVKDLSLKDSLQRRQIAKVLMPERKHRLKMLIDDVNVNYC